MRTFSVVAASLLLPVIGLGCGSAANSDSGPAPRPGDASAVPVIHEDSLDVKPVILSRGQARFPNRLREEYIGGDVWMEFIVDRRGRVEESSIRILCSTRREFEQPAVIARRRFRYNPGRVADAPVRTLMRDNVRFVVTRRGVRQARPICEPETDLPRFFAANRWVDKNQNGRAERDEFEGVKSEFSGSERVTFIVALNDLVGAQVQGVVKAPNGATTSTVHETQAFANQFLRMEFLVQDLIAEQGPGVWTVEWYVQGNYAGASRATLIR